MANEGVQTAEAVMDDSSADAVVDSPCIVTGDTAISARRYGACASPWVRDEARRRAENRGMIQAARELGVSPSALARTIAGLQQAPGTIDRISAKLSELAT